MAAYRCPLCSINYPVNMGTNVCPVHNATMFWALSAVPDPDWLELATEIAETMEEEPEPADIPQVDVPIREDGTILSWDVHNILFRRLEPGELIRIGEQDYEIALYTDENRRYTIRPFSSSLSDDDLKKLRGDEL